VRTRIASATLLVTVLDTEAPTLLGQFASRSGVAATIEKSRAKGVLEGSEMARVFAWLRPNDLVWLFVANNWVMGNRPPAFDILYWNSDTTRLPAEFHADLLRMFMENPLKSPGRITALGTPIDMSKVNVPAYVVAGRHGSHHAVASVLSIAKHPARQDRLRALIERPHSEHREPTHQSEGQILPQSVDAGRCRNVVGRCE
jgi:poly(3-hydroxyalkanoate) synthetase